MYSSITPSAKHVNHSITRRDFTLQRRLSDQLNQQVFVLWKVANCLGKLPQGSKRRFPKVHQHRVVISRAGSLARHGSAKFQSQPIGYLKDGSGLDRGTSRWRGRFYHGPIGRGSGVGFFIGSLGNEPLGQGWTSETSLRAGRTRSMRGARGAMRLGQNSALSRVLARIRRIVDS
jgi:hypothetical protein